MGKGQLQILPQDFEERMGELIAFIHPRLIRFRIDSGADMTAVNPLHSALEGYETFLDEQSKVTYRTASGANLRDLGCVTVKISGHEFTLDLRMVPVRNPLMSTRMLTEMGYRVILDHEEGYMEHKITGEVIKFDKDRFLEGTVYTWQVEVLEPPRGPARTGKADAKGGKDRPIENVRFRERGTQRFQGQA